MTEVIPEVVEVKPSIYLVDVEYGVNANKVFTPTSQEIKAFGAEKNLFDYFATVVDSQFEEKIIRLKGIRKYEYGGVVTNFTFEVTEGQPSLVLVVEEPSTGEIPIPTT